MFKIAYYRRVLWMVFCFLTLFAVPALAGVSAYVDRQTIQEGESLQLTIVMQGQQDSAVDFSSLEKTFEILGTSRSQQAKMRNGKSSVQTQWTLLLSPKRQGKIVIPSFNIGSVKTDPIAITVLAASAIAHKAQQQALFLITDIKPKNPYVQSQMVYVLRVFYTVTLRNVSITDPVLSRGVVQRLDDDKNYQAKRNGQAYQVFERRYAIFPQHSGQQIIKGPVVVGEVLSPGSLPRIKRLRAKEVTIQVKPMPARMKDHDWLPAKQLEIAEEWSGKVNQLKEGEPITRTITTTAVGLPAAQLPKIKQDSISGMKIYPDQGELYNFLQDDWIVGKRVDKITYIPTKTGAITLPPIRLHWWDRTTGKSKFATLPGRTLRVVSGGSTRAAKHQTVNPSASDHPILPQLKSKQLGFFAGAFWKLLAASLLAAWIVTLFAWFRTKNKKSTPAMNTDPEAGALNHTKKPQREVTLACQHNDPCHAKRALIAWGALIFPEKQIYSLGELRIHARSSAFKEALGSLDKMLYSDAKLPDWRGEIFLQIFLQEIDLQKKDKRSQRNEKTYLPPLHPL